MAEAKTFGLSQISQIAITAHDVARAEKFYREQLGMEFLFAVSGLVFFNCGGVRLMLSRPEKPEFDHPSSILYFKVENIQDAFRTLSDRGVKFDEGPQVIARMPEYDLWLASFRDSENNLLALMSEVAR